MIGEKSPIHGVGINDADYKVSARINGKQVLCKYYSTWKGIMQRCFDLKFKNKHPTYKSVVMYDEWKYLSNFRKWCINYEKLYNCDISTLQIDKDILKHDNKEYHPDSCCFVDHRTNSFVLTSKRTRGDYFIGVDYHKSSGKFRAICNNPLDGERHYIGVYDTELEAHKAWQTRKNMYALQLAELQHDPRVAEALRMKYSNDKDLTYL